MSETTGIHCPIDFFPRQEAQVTRLIEAINRARTAVEKSPRALQLTEAVDVLLACERYDEKRMDCRLCRNVAALRRKTASLVAQVGRESR